MPDSQSVTIAEAGRLWLVTSEAGGLERTTLDQYRAQLELHIVPLIGAMKLSRFTAPMARAFEDKLLGLDRSPVMVRKVMVSLSAIPGRRARAEVSLARTRLAPSASLSSPPGQGGARRQASEGQAKGGDRHPYAGRDPGYPGPHRLRPSGEPVLMTAIFTGLRASELRGLRWADVDLKRGELSVRQRADRFNTIGRPKSESGERVVPFPPELVSVLREHRLACPKGPFDLVFPNGVEQDPAPGGDRTARAAGGSGRSGRRHRRRQGKISRVARAPAFLCELVHQSSR